MDRYLCVLLGGGLGAVLRYAVGTAVASRYSTRLPLGTFFINISGSFLIGLLMTLFTERYAAHPNWRLFLVTGVLGGYTTFSSFEYEVLLAGQSESPALAFLYVLSSVGFGFLAVWLGYFILAKR
ncbi:MAG TPA: fluoride efflux transporter CrcB [Bryobacteraceae bacterium]|nr:fluoride efflux transporter CrcB [Bryobacteraceae bacterium]